MRGQLTTMDGQTLPGTLLGRWIDRSQGRDDAELEREARSASVQQRRLGSWGGTPNGAVRRPPASRQGDPAHEPRATRRRAASLLSYGELYALWERQNWKAHELDFSVDREQWLATPRESQVHTTWSLGSFYIGEERVTADLAPFLLRGAERRGRAVPRHPARGRGAPRRVLRPLRRRGDGARRPTTCAGA